MVNDAHAVIIKHINKSPVRKPLSQTLLLEFRTWVIRVHHRGDISLIILVTSLLQDSNEYVISMHTRHK